MAKVRTILFWILVIMFIAAVPSGTPEDALIVYLIQHYGLLTYAFIVTFIILMIHADGYTTEDVKKAIKKLVR